MRWRVYAPPTKASYDGASRGGIFPQRPHQGHPATVPSARASDNRAFSRRLLITVPSARASCNRAPLQGGILKPPALRVVVDLADTLSLAVRDVGDGAHRMRDGMQRAEPLDTLPPAGRFDPTPGAAPDIPQNRAADTMRRIHKKDGTLPRLRGGAAWLPLFF